MKINALTVCVNYADLLAMSIDRWAGSLASLTIVTDMADTATADLAKHAGAGLFRTDVFYERGAKFNKGAALEAARQAMPWSEWILFFDADIVPEREWSAKVDSCMCQPGSLYSARRRECIDPADRDRTDLPMILGDGVGVGYFQLFHSTDEHAQDVPLLDTTFTHAGVYDSLFMHRWHGSQRHLLPIVLTHLGPRDNWFGRGNVAAFDAMKAERQRRGGSYEHERIGR